MGDKEACEHERFDEEGMKYCPDCGEALTICPSCDCSVERDWEYCPFCGKDLER